MLTSPNTTVLLQDKTAFVRYFPGDILLCPTSECRFSTTDWVEMKDHMESHGGKDTDLVLRTVYQNHPAAGPLTMNSVDKYQEESMD